MDLLSRSYEAMQKATAAMSRISRNEPNIHKEIAATIAELLFNLPEEVRPKHNDSFSPPRIAGLGRLRLRSALMAIAPNASFDSIEELADAIMASRATFMK